MCLCAWHSGVGPSDFRAARPVTLACVTVPIGRGSRQLAFSYAQNVVCEQSDSDIRHATPLPPPLDHFPLV